MVETVRQRTICADIGAYEKRQFVVFAPAQRCQFGTFASPKMRRRLRISNHSIWVFSCNALAPVAKSLRCVKAALTTHFEKSQFGTFGTAEIGHSGRFLFHLLQDLCNLC
jgi:hypothetical protein